jgi:hypothetical protein
MLDAVDASDRDGTCGGSAVGSRDGNVQSMSDGPHGAILPADGWFP